jgi:hypothetical protein
MSNTTTTPERRPNLYQVHGKQLFITYSTTSLDGKPRFLYRDPHQTLSFEGDAIRSITSELGTEVTVTIHMTVDTGSTSFTLLVPNVNLGQSDHTPISTIGVTTIHHVFFSNPALSLGQTDTYNVSRLAGTASAVVF